MCVYLCVFVCLCGGSVCFCLCGCGGGGRYVFQWRRVSGRQHHETSLRELPQTQEHSAVPRGESGRLRASDACRAHRTTAQH